MGVHKQLTQPTVHGAVKQVLNVIASIIFSTAWSSTGKEPLGCRKYHNVRCFQDLFVYLRKIKGSDGSFPYSLKSWSFPDRMLFRYSMDSIHIKCNVTTFFLDD